MFKRNRTSELVVVKPRYSSRVKMLITVVIVIGILIAGGAIYNRGLSQGGFEYLLASRKQADLKKEAKELEEENQEFRESLARAQRAQQMNETTFQELDQSLKQSAAEIVKLREEISFYRNILAPDNNEAGLRIQSLQILPTDKDDRYRYKLVVIQALKHDRLIRGQARFEIAGLQAGKNTVLRFPGSKGKSIRVNFKYFQDIEGYFDLPRNFEPNRIKVSVTTRGKNAKKVEQEYSWPRTRA